MLFNSLAFLFGFLPIVYFVFWRLTTRKQRHVWLAVTGYVFYSFWNVKFCLLMFVSTLVSYLAGLGFLRWSDPRTRRWLLVVPIVFDLSLLGFFKYGNFFLDGIDQTLDMVRPSASRCCDSTSSCRSASRSTRSTRSPTSSMRIAA